MTSAAMIAFIDDFLTTRVQRTAIVLDNAPIHKSYEFQEAIKKWEEQDLFIFFLPTYSPHLNIIETLWRKIKYEWLKPQQYENAQILKQAVFDILKSYNQKFKIVLVDFDKNCDPAEKCLQAQQAGAFAVVVIYDHNKKDSINMAKSRVSDAVTILCYSIIRQ